MAGNPFPDSNAPLFTMAEDMADGAHTHEVAIGLKQNKEADIRADLSAARLADTAVATAKKAKSDASTAQQVADSNGKAFIALTKSVLTPALGNSWSTQWGEVGFKDNSLAIPSAVADRQELLKSIHTWLAGNLTREVTTPDYTFTAAAAEAAFDALSGARSAFNQSTVIIGQKITLRDAAVAVLEKRMRGLIGELEELLGDSDPRWYAFGLNAPADPATPGIPDGLALNPGSAGIVYAHWAAARRADHYRVWKQIVGVDTEFKAVSSVNDPDAALSGLPSGKTVKIQITAVNDAGESQPSATVEIVVP